MGDGVMSMRGRDTSYAMVAVVIVVVSAVLIVCNLMGEVSEVVMYGGR